MKNLIYILLTFFLFIFSTYSQQKDSLIQLYPGLGDTLDFIDREYFGLLQNISGFEKATFYIRDNKYLISKIIFKRNETFFDTLAVQSLSVLDAMRSNVERILLENKTKVSSPREVIILTREGKEFSGKLEMFSKDNLYLSSTKNLQAEESAERNSLIPANKLEKVTFESKSNVLASVGWGVLAGAALGGTMALASGDNELAQGLFLIAGAFFSVVGGAIGYFIGMSGSEDEVVIRIDNQIDLLKLKNYAKYYFRNDKTLEEKYVELE